MSTAQPPGIRGVRITGAGVALPPRVVTNDELAREVETSDDWITQRTGIRQRHIVAADEGVVTLGVEAARQALERAGLDAAELDLVICATMTPDMCCPASGARIAAELGATPAGGFDLSAACSGFVYALNLAESYIRTGGAEHVAVIGAETLSRIVDWKDRRTCILFGDGAGAAILSADDDPARGSRFQRMYSDGGKWMHLYCPRQEQHLPEGHEFSGAFDTLQMNGREVYKFAVSTLAQCVKEATDACGLSPRDLAVIIPHQSNARILESACEKLGLASEQMYVNIDRMANTSAASVPICLAELFDAGRLHEGDHVLFVGMGGGLTWATNLWRL